MMFFMPVAIYCLVIKQAFNDLTCSIMTRVWPTAPPIDHP